MKPINQSIVNQTGGIADSDMVGFSAKTENLGVLFHILRNQLYSNPILAVIREYSTNARDAHSAAGKPKKPIQITLPTVLESFFKVRDFGKGLDEEGIKEIFSSYGESTKRNTNAQTGMLGIGCKSAFAYGDSFIVNSYRDGKMESWSAFLDPSQQGKMAKIAADDTKEPDGLEVVVSVRTPDISKFRSEAIKFFEFFDVLPDFVNLDSNELTQLNTVRNDVGRYHGEGWKLLYGSAANLTARSFAVMGNIAYPINADIFKDEISAEIKDMLKIGLIINFKLGDLEFAASREALQYTTHTKTKMLARLKKIAEEIIAQTQKEFDVCKTLWEARVLYREVFSSSGKLYGLRSLFKPSNLTFNNFPINAEEFTTRITGMSCAYYTENQTHDRVARETGYEIPARRDIMVVENDTDICNLIINRIAPVLKDSTIKWVYLIKFEDAVAKAEWIRVTGFDGPITSLAKLPRKNLGDFYRHMVMPSASFNRKHALKEFKLNVAMIIGNRSGSASDYWEEVKVDPAQDSGVWMGIERFEGKAFRYSYQHPRDFDGILTDLQALGIAIPTIYGFKRSSAELATKNPNMQQFTSWVIERVAEFFKNNPQVEQDFVNKVHLKSWSYDSHKDLSDFARMVTKWKDLPDNSLKKYLKSYLEAHQKHEDLKHFEIHERCIELTGYKTKLKCNLDLEGSYDAERTKYPMFMVAAQVAGTYQIQHRDDFKKASLEYIKLIDGIHAAASPMMVVPQPPAQAPSPLATNAV